jgi:hypothetical protein
MSMAAYALNPFDTVLTHGGYADLWLHDLPEDADELHAHALVASGDYLEMLAAELEQIVLVLPTGSVEQYRLQDIIDQLLYLQHHYALTKTH